MAIHRFPKTLLALWLAGCAAAPKTHQPARLQFDTESDLNWTVPFTLADNLDGSRLLTTAATDQGAMIVRQSQDGGKTFSPARETPNPLTDGFGDKGRIRLMQTAATAVLLDESLLRGDLVSATSGNGEDWEKGGRLAIKPLQGVVSFDTMDAGNTTVAAVGPSQTMQFPLYVSSNEGGDWEVKSINVPVPEGYQGTTVTPPGAFGTPKIVVDGRDRIHWLLPEYRFSDSSGKKQTGSLYVNLEGPRAQFFPAEFRSQEGALGENRKLPDHLYRVTASEAESKEKSRISIPYALEFSQSQDGGAHWSPPCVLDDHNGTKQWLQVNGEGPLLVVSWRDDRSSQPGLYACSSTDGGKSWSEAERLGDLPDRYKLVVCNGQVLLAGCLAGRSPFEPGPAFAIHGKVKP